MTTCPKCAYARRSTDAGVPDWQCPRCGIAYAKFQAQPQVAARPARQHEERGGGAKALGFIVLALLVGGAGFAYTQFGLEEEADEVAPQVAAASRSVSTGERLETDHPAYFGTLEPEGPVLRLKPELATDLSRVAPGRVVLFATDWCGYCAQTRKIFKQQGITYTEVDIEKDAGGARFFKTVMGGNGVPGIVIGNRVMLGFDEKQILAGLKEL